MASSPEPPSVLFVSTTGHQPSGRGGSKVKRMLVVCVLVGRSAQVREI